MTSCVTFEAANRLYPRPAGASAIEFQLPANFGASPELWLSWLQPTRIAHLRSFFPRRPGEPPQMYDSRLRMIATQVTTKAVASGARFPRSPRPAGLGDSTDITKDTGTGATGTGSTPSTGQVAIGAVATILGQSADLIRAAMHEGNETERARIDAASRERIAELQQQLTTSSDPATQSATQAMIDQLNSLRGQLGHASDKGLSTGTMIALGIGAVAILGGIAFFAMRSGGARHNPVMIDRHGRRRFIPAGAMIRHNPEGHRGRAHY